MRGWSVVALSLGLLSSLACALGAKCGEGTELVDGACVAVEEEPEETDVVEDTTPEEAPPEITSFTSDVHDVTQGGGITFTVEATDPQGDEDIAIATLQAPGGAQYGTFTSSGAGTWTISIGWADFHEMNSIDFDLEEERTLVAHLVDRAANAADAEITVRLHCGGQPACTGVCTDVTNDPENCGACGNTCDNCSGGSCYAYECVSLTEGVDNCDEACAAIGMECGGDVCSGGTTTGYMIGDGTCDSFSQYRIVDECDTTFLDGYQLLAKCCCAG